MRYQTELGDQIREKFEAHDWRVVNDTPLPTVCFIDSRAQVDRVHLHSWLSEGCAAYRNPTAICDCDLKRTT